MSGLQRSVARLLAMGHDELRDRAAGAIRAEAGWLAHTVRAPRWHRADLRRALDESVVRPDVLAHVRAGRWPQAHEALLGHFASRPPRFVLDPRSRDTLPGAVRAQFPAAAADAARRADAIAQGHFDLLGYRGLSFGSTDLTHARPEIDWHFDPVHDRRAPRRYWTRVPFLAPECGDHKIIWELNRHQHWLVLGRAYWLTGHPRYREAFLEQFESWMAANPPLTGINWASMLEIALRSLSWIWALHFFAAAREDGERDAAPWIVDLLLALDRQLTLVERNLSTYFSPNTHLLGEALALYVAGRALPELRRAARWEQLGRTVLVEQASRQIHADGGHAELSLHYHRYTLDFYLLAFAVARTTGDRLAPLFAGIVGPLAAFARAVADSTGRLPRIGDDDGGMLLPICGRDAADVSDSLALAAHLLDRPELALGPAPEEVAWMAGVVPHIRSAFEPARSQALRGSGYVVCRSPRGDHLLLDAGRHGFLNGGHAHADALSMTLTVAGSPLLIDPGTGSYTVDAAMRDRFRASQCHNTITIDGRSQSEPNGPFHWSSMAQGTLSAWRSNQLFDYVAASHDGYAPIVHHRTVLARPGCWFIVDRLIGTGTHRVDRHWHLDPRWQVTLDDTRVRADLPAGMRAWFLSGETFDAFSGAGGSRELGWCAPVYGVLVPTTTLRSSRLGDLPCTMVTAIVDAGDPPTLEELPVVEDGRASGLAVAFRLRTTQWTDVVLVGPPGTHPAEHAAWRPRRRAGGLESDAALVCRRVLAAGDASALLVVDGATVRDERGAALLDLPQPAADVAVITSAEGDVRIVSSAPLGEMRHDTATPSMVRARGAGLAER